jgi:hypothetical protein
MSTDNITLGDLKQILAMFGAAKPTTEKHPFIGTFCIARCYAAGVHAGRVVSVDGENVILENSRRLWSWKAQNGIALSGVAQSGMQAGCKVDSMNPLIYLTGVCELIPVGPGVEAQIREYK